MASVEEEHGWAELVAEVLESVQFDTALDAPVVDRTAEAAVRSRTFHVPPQRLADALTEGLASRVTLTDLVPVEADEASARDFLRRLLHRMRESRPWPEWRYEQVPLSDWDPAATRPVAWLALSPVRLGNRLGIGFDRIRDGDGHLEMAVLRLSGGQVVALCRSLAAADTRTAVLHGSDEPADSVLRSFLWATGLGRSVVAAVQGKEDLVSESVGLRHGLAYSLPAGRVAVGFVSNPDRDGRPVHVELTVLPKDGEEHDVEVAEGDRFMIGPEAWSVRTVENPGTYDYTVWITRVGEDRTT